MTTRPAPPKLSPKCLTTLNILGKALHRFSFVKPAQWKEFLRAIVEGRQRIEKVFAKHGSRVWQDPHGPYGPSFLSVDQVLKILSTPTARLLRKLLGRYLPTSLPAGMTAEQLNEVTAFRDYWANLDSEIGADYVHDSWDCRDLLHHQVEDVYDRTFWQPVHNAWMAAQSRQDRGKVRREGKPKNTKKRRELKPVEKAVWRRLYKGETRAQIARELGVTRQAVHSTIQRIKRVRSQAGPLGLSRQSIRAGRIPEDDRAQALISRHD